MYHQIGKQLYQSLILILLIFTGMIRYYYPVFHQKFQSNKQNNTVCISTMFFEKEWKKNLNLFLP